MPRIVEVVLRVEVSEQETTNFLSRIVSGTVVGTTPTAPAPVAPTMPTAAPAPAGEAPVAPTMPTVAPAPVAPVTGEAPVKKGRGRPKKTDAAAPAPVAPTMPTAAPAPTMPAMPGMPTAAPAPVTVETMLAAYNSAITAGKITNEHVLAKYAEIGITDPNMLNSDEGKRTLLYNWLISL